MAVAAGSVLARAAAEAMAWQRAARGAHRMGPRRAVGLVVELPRAVLRASSSAAGGPAPPRASRPSGRDPPPTAGVSEVGTSSRPPARPSPAAAVSVAAGRSGSGGGGGAGAERQRQRSSSRTAVGARGGGPAGGDGPPPLSSFPLPRLEPAARLLPPPSLLRARPDPVWAMRAALEARALRWRPWRGGGRRGLRRRSAHAGGGREEEVLGRPRVVGCRIDGHDFFLLTWHDVVPPFGA